MCCRYVIELGSAVTISDTMLSGCQALYLPSSFKDVDAIGLVRKRRTNKPPLQELTAFLSGYGNDSHHRISPDAATSSAYGRFSPACHRRTHGGVGCISRGLLA